MILHSSLFSRAFLWSRCLIPGAKMEGSKALFRRGRVGRGGTDVMGGGVTDRSAR